MPCSGGTDPESWLWLLRIAAIELGQASCGFEEHAVAWAIDGVLQATGVVPLDRSFTGSSPHCPLAVWRTCDSTLDPPAVVLTEPGPAAHMSRVYIRQKQTE